MRYLLIINPISGTANKDRLPLMAQSALGGARISIDIHLTTGPGDATIAAKRAIAEGYDAVLAAGGDGTINEIASALVNSPVALGIIPSGSGNGLARHLGIPIDHRESLEVIARGHIETCDSAAVNGTPFFCTFGLGFDAAVSHRFAGKSRRGRLSYISSVLEEYRVYHPEHYTISWEGEIITDDAFLVTVANASQYGNNAYIAPHASIMDGMLDLTIIHSGRPLNAAKMGIELFTGYIDRDTTIRTLRAPAFTISRTTPGPAHIDGEPVNLAETLECRCSPASLRVLCNKPDPDFQPIITPLRSFLEDTRIAIAHLLRH